MIYYMIRHKATGEFMPELDRTRGYSFWNPSREPTNQVFTKSKLLGVPRLFAARRNASRAIIQWNANPNSKMTGSQSYDGEWDEFIDSKPDGRSKNDLEIVEVNIEEVK